ncbi:MAG: zinc-ribbon domain-containing protein, partial [Bacilli bacterium]
KPTMVSANSGKKVWWKCEKGHEWQASIYSRTSGVGCPICAGKQVLKGYNDLATINPKLASEWNNIKNGSLKPTMFSANSHKKVWWKCTKEHEWQASIANRTKGNGCPICSGRQALKGLNDLATINPKLASEWNNIKNGSLKPTGVTCNSNKRVWWQCSKGHEWQAIVNSRAKGNGCPICSGRQVLKGFNDLETINPKLASEWNNVKNGSLKPNMFSANSGKKVWWKCSKGHEWQASIYSRTYGVGCPICAGKQVLKGFNDLETINPKLASEWNNIKNGSLKPTMVSANSGKKVWWKCEKGHEWQAVIASRNKGRACPTCNNESQTSFPEQAIYYYCKRLYNNSVNRYRFESKNNCEIDIYIPELKIGIEYNGKYYHRNKQQKDARKVLFFAKKGIKIISIKEVETTQKNSSNVINISTPVNDAKLNDAIKKLFILMELNKYVGIINIQKDRILIEENTVKTKKYYSLLKTNPKVSSEWDYAKNGKLKPEMYTPNSGKKLWWKCSKGHEWQASIYSRTSGAECPICSGRQVLKGFNDLETINPKLASEWNNVKNGSLKPTMVSANSGKKVWWKCEKGHEWQAVIASRNKGNGCPICAGKQVLKGFNDLETINPKLASEWNNIKNGSLKPTMFSANSHKKVWWKCSKGHEWQASIIHRNKGQNCPICYKIRIKKVSN